MRGLVLKDREKAEEEIISFFLSRGCEKGLNVIARKKSNEEKGFLLNGERRMGGEPQRTNKKSGTREAEHEGNKVRKDFGRLIYLRGRKVFHRGKSRGEVTGERRGSRALWGDPFITTD